MSMTGHNDNFPVKYIFKFTSRGKLIVSNCACSAPLNVLLQSDNVFTTVCKDCDVLCQTCLYEEKEPVCNAVIDHSSSPGGSATVEMLLIEHGYWRASNTSTNIFACYNPDACQGGVTGSPGYCLKGYEGPCKCRKACLGINWHYNYSTTITVHVFRSDSFRRAV